VYSGKSLLGVKKIKIKIQMPLLEPPGSALGCMDYICNLNVVTYFKLMHHIPMILSNCWAFCWTIYSCTC
jgi:hypothetical protein